MLIYAKDRPAQAEILVAENGEIVVRVDGKAVDFTDWVLRSLWIAEASPEERAHLLRWLRHSAAAMLGAARSERKAEAARRNARKGGWPKGRPRKEKSRAIHQEAGD